MMSFEVTGLDPLRRLAKKARESFPKNARAAVEVTLRKVKDEARSGAAAIGGQASGYEKSIDYNLPRSSADQVEGEVGFRRGRRRSGLPLEVGTRHTAPKPVLRRALENNTEDFYEGISKAVKDSFG